MTKAELADALVRHFVQGYFRQNPDTHAVSDYPIVKWSTEISISLVHPELLPDGMNDHPHELVTALRAAGFDIGLNAAATDRANVSIILFDDADGFSQTDLDILRSRMSGNDKGLAYFVSQFDQRSTCFMGGGFGRPFHLKSAFAAINANKPAATIKHCLNSVIPGIVGFQGKVDAGVVQHSLFSSNESVSDISDWDRLAFRILADPRLPAGMRYDEPARSLIQKIAAELIAAWPDPNGLEDQLKAN